MAKSPPSFKKSSDPRVGTGSAQPFKSDKISDCKKVETRHPCDLRDGFARKYYMYPAQPHGLPESVDSWKVKKPKTDKKSTRGLDYVEDARKPLKGRTVSAGPRSKKL